LPIPKFAKSPQATANTPVKDNHLPISSLTSSPTKSVIASSCPVSLIASPADQYEEHAEVSERSRMLLSLLQKDGNEQKKERCEGKSAEELEEMTLQVRRMLKLP